MATARGRYVQEQGSRTRFEGVPTSILSLQLDQARDDLKASQRRAALIRRELKRRKRHTIR